MILDWWNLTADAQYSDGLHLGGLSQSFAPKVFGSGGKLKRCFAREAEIFAGLRPDQDDKRSPQRIHRRPYGVPCVNKTAFPCKGISNIEL